MKEYPFIGRFENGFKNTVLFFKKDEGVIIDSNNTVNRKRKFKQSVFDKGLKNITSEFLDNTYGEVGGRRHAEFIVKLCNLHDIRLKCLSVPSERYWFMIINGGLYFYSSNFIPERNKCRQIDIPPQPECEDVDIDDGEWPEIGDEVLIDPSEREVIYGQNVDGMSAVVRYIFKDGETDVYAVSRDGACYCFVRDILKKPKTEVDILRDELIELTLSHMENKEYTVEANAYYLVSDLLHKYINKNPNP